MRNEFAHGNPTPVGQSDTLAALLQRLGAWRAMNFDGGVSTTMIIDGQVVNAPSDPTGERPVGNARVEVQKP